MQTYNLPDKFDDDISNLEELINKCIASEITPAELKAHRVPFGVYEQRKVDTYMVRIRCASGTVTPKQLEEISKISERLGNEKIHITTRQELQVHYVKLGDIIPVIKALRDIGLASRGGGGNTVRNIIAQEDSGIAKDEIFDVAPYATALTTRLISEKDSWTLPRKFKIAFSSSSSDRGYATLADIGFIARVKDGKIGFKVYVAGGMGAKSNPGHFFLDFISDDQVYNLTKAIKNIFWKYGNRKNKHAARLRFLFNDIGEDEFRKRFDQELGAVEKENYLPLEIKANENIGLDPDLGDSPVKDQEDFRIWKERFVKEQKQEGLFSIIVGVELGFLANEKALKLAQFLIPFGENVIRLTKDQNINLRNIKEKHLSHLYLFLKENFNGFNRPFILDKLISCAGASTCQLGICLSRGAARSLISTLGDSDLNLDKLANLKVNISGCPNSCGQHPAADLGFFGKANRKDGELYPAYNVLAGGVIKDEETKLSKKLGEVSAKDLPKLVKEFLADYIKAEEFKTYQDYLASQGNNKLVELCKKYSKVPSLAEDKNYYYDWESKDIFSLAGRGMGECSAGLFDLIDVDLKNIVQTTEKLNNPPVSGEARGLLLFNLVFYATRMLLITRGVEPKVEMDVYTGFRQHFLDTKLVDSSFREVIDAGFSKNHQILLKEEDKISDLVKAVKYLYEHMDNAFGFKVPGLEKKAASDKKERVVKDFRGVACPMNFVKTKLELAKLQSKETLEIYLDDGEPIDNVPGSVKAEGHRIVTQEKIEDYWSVIIEKK